MEYIKIYNNKKIRRIVFDLSTLNLGGVRAFLGDMWFWQPDEMESEIKKGTRRWHANSSCVDLLDDGNFRLSREGGPDVDYDFIDFFTVSRPALYDFMEQWKKIDEDAFEKIIITYDGNKFEIEKSEKMTPEEENDPMWIERFKPRD
jgi:hypothetical protein